MAAMVDNKPSVINSILQQFEWGFSPDSFGKSTFEQINNEDINFIPGNIFQDFRTDVNFEYIIANRYYEKEQYIDSIDINPLIIWYGNLAKVKNGYVDPKTDELKIKIENNNIYILRDYLRDFLSAYNKCCVLCFDNRRFSSNKPNVNLNNNICDLFCYQIAPFTTLNSNMKFGTSILGKIIIKPYTQPHHEDYLYFKPETQQYAEFIIGINRDTGDNIKFTCDESKLSNFLVKTQEHLTF